MRIGLVCEGPTDLPAVQHFLDDQLSRSGIEATFRNLFPEPDRSRPIGGWSNLFLWLMSNSADTRVARYFGSGLFGDDLAENRLDAIVIQVDADVIDDPAFQAIAADKLNVTFEECDQPNHRADRMSRALQVAGDFASLSNSDSKRHVLAVAVEATETWCVAAFRGQPDQYENLRGNDLTNAFMNALEMSEGRQPADNYMNCSKDIVRRNRFCLQMAPQSQRVVNSCPSFAAARDSLVALSPP